MENAKETLLIFTCRKGRTPQISWKFPPPTHKSIVVGLIGVMLMAYEWDEKCVYETIIKSDDIDNTNFNI